MKTISKMMIAMLLVFAIFAAGCTQVQPGSTTTTTLKGNVQFEQGSFLGLNVFNPEQDIESNSFKTEEEVKNFVKAHQESSYYGGYYGGVRGLGMESFAPTMEGANVKMSADSGSSNTQVQSNSNEGDFSETNNQVKGVDEADIIKTDGNYIYTVTGKTLYIIKAYPGEDAKILSTIKLKSAPTGLFIQGDRLAVFGNVQDADFYKEIDYTPRSGMTYLEIYDISDRENPDKEKDFKFEGYYFEGRMKDGYVYLVSVKYPNYRDPYPVPILYRDGFMMKVDASNIHYYNIPYNSPVFANINSINLADDMELNSESVIVEGSQNMYMSENNIFITYTEYINEYEITQKITIEMIEDKLSDSDKELVEKIKETDDEILSQQEKMSKIMQIVYSYIDYLPEKERDALQDEIDTKAKEEIDSIDFFEFTVINRIGIDEGKITVEDTGKVPGHIMNQFSMDENDNVFRIATTVSQRWSQYGSESIKSTNHIFTLDKNLNVLDSLDDFAEGEQIYSTRFMGDRLYMVTFRQVDPFFVIDLSNPNKISELGQLKIPGFSRYLHPYDDNTIIGIGRDASETGQQRGLKISLFDVSDVENPKEVAKFTTDERYASSIAEYEHKAFLFSKEKNLLVIPVYSYNWEGESRTGYNGALVFSITKDEIDVKGLIDHSQGSSNYYSPSVERSLYIQDMLYTKSPNLLRVNDLDTLKGVKNITLGESDAPFEVY